MWLVVVGRSKLPKLCTELLFLNCWSCLALVPRHGAVVWIVDIGGIDVK